MTRKYIVISLFFGILLFFGIYYKLFYTLIVYLFVLSPYGVTALIYGGMIWISVVAVRRFRTHGWWLLLPALFFGGFGLESFRERFEVQSHEREFADIAYDGEIGVMPNHVTLVTPHLGRCDSLCYELLMERHVDAVFVVAKDIGSSPSAELEALPIYRYFLGGPQSCLGETKSVVTERVAAKYKIYRILDYCIDRTQEFAAPDGFRIYNTATSPQRPEFKASQLTIGHITQANGGSEVVLAHREYGTVSVKVFPPVLGPAWGSPFVILERNITYGKRFTLTSFVAASLGLNLDSRIDPSLLPDISERLNLIERTASDPSASLRRDTAKLIGLIIHESNFDKVGPHLQNLLSDEDETVARAAILAIDPSVRQSGMLIPTILEQIESRNAAKWAAMGLKRFGSAALAAHFSQIADLTRSTAGDTRIELIELLIRFDAAAVPLLIELLKSDDDSTVGATARALAKFNFDQAGQAVPSLLVALESVEGIDILHVFNTLKEFGASDQALKIVARRLQLKPDDNSKKYLERVRD